MEKLITRIKKLLALASNNPSETEAEAALLMAQRLMAEQGISMAQVEAQGDQQQERVVEQPLDRGAIRLSVWERALAGVIAENFRCYRYTWRSQQGAKICFIGMESDVEIATTTFQAAFQCAQNLATRYMKRRQAAGYEGHGRRLRTDYLLGWVTGLKVKYDEQRAANQQWAIVLARPKAVDEAVAMTIKSKKITNKAQRIRTPRQEAFAAGHADGKQFGSAVETVEPRPVLKEG